MRLRFSIRTLLILTALAAAACYWWVARPSVTAREFARNVDAEDYRAAGAMVSYYVGIVVLLDCDCENRVEIHRRDWSDLLHRPRRITLHRTGSDGRTQAQPLVATSSDIRRPDWRDRDHWPTYQF
jgi:hypothetical protein